MMPRRHCVRILLLFLSVSLFDRQANRVVAEETIRSLQYVETSGLLKAGPDYVMQVVVLNGCIKRSTMRKKPEQGFQTHEPAPPDSTDFFSIHDAKKGLLVCVDPGKREYKVAQGVLQCFGPNQYRFAAVVQNPQANFEAPFRKPIDLRNAKELPEQIVDGRRAVGYFEVEHSDRRGVGTATYWVDPETKLPIRIERRFKPADPAEDTSVLLRRNFIFDAPIDPKLFNTDPPEGYTVLPEIEYWEVAIKFRTLFGAFPIGPFPIW